MTNLYDDFEKRFTNAFFSVGWVEVEPEKGKETATHKDLTTLQDELDDLQERMENIELNRLRLSNLAKMYNS